MDTKEYIFSIDAFKPETLPMWRLAQYMEQLANLYGCKDQVHFVGIEKGSVVLKSMVENTAIPKVNARLVSFNNHDAPTDAAKAWDELNTMLQKDNAKGFVGCNDGEKIIVFPGRETLAPEFKGTIAQTAIIDGRIVGITGIDATKHVHIEYNDGKFHCECKEDLARQLKVFLYEQEIRLHGNARYVRNEKNKWELKKFTILSYETLDNTVLEESVERIRAIEGEWSNNKDAWDMLISLRHDSDEAH